MVVLCLFLSVPRTTVATDKTFKSTSKLNMYTQKQREDLVRRLRNLVSRENGSHQTNCRSHMVDINLNNRTPKPLLDFWKVTGGRGGGDLKGETLGRRIPLPSLETNKRRWGVTVSYVTVHRCIVTLRTLLDTVVVVTFRFGRNPHVSHGMN